MDPGRNEVFDRIDLKFDQLEERMDELRRIVTRFTYTMISIMVVGFTALHVAL